MSVERSSTEVKLLKRLPMGPAPYPGNVSKEGEFLPGELLGSVILIWPLYEKSSGPTKGTWMKGLSPKGTVATKTEIFNEA